MTPSMWLVDLVLLGLAAGAIVDVWFNGSIFDPLRAEVEAYADYKDTLWTRLLLCWYCLSHHAVIWPALGLIPAYLMAEPYSVFFRVPLLICAAIRLNFIINAMLPAEWKYDRTEAIAGQKLAEQYDDAEDL